MFILLTALYARVSVTCNQCKLRHQRTTQKKRWEVTVFNEVMTFVLPDQQIRECSILVSVFELQPSKKSSKRLMGNIHFKTDKTTENEHWKLMMQSLRQPIAKWHLIFIWIRLMFIDARTCALISQGGRSYSWLVCVFSGWNVETACALSGIKSAEGLLLVFLHLWILLAPWTLYYFFFNFNFSLYFFFSTNNNI